LVLVVCINIVVYQNCLMMLNQFLLFYSSAVVKRS